MRINKYIGESGICSRREADKLIEEKRVTINGSICELGALVRPGDIIAIDGVPIEEKNKKVYIAFNKPVGVECTTNKRIPNNIINFIDYPKRIFPIGRLDKDSEGLILLTNDGDIVNKILNQKYENEKEYIVTVNKGIDTNFLKDMSKGVKINGIKTKPCTLYPISNRTFGIILTQGLNRQIRKMCEIFGYKVIKLRRIRIMNIKLRHLKTGHWRNISKTELDELKKVFK